MDGMTLYLNSIKIRGEEQMGDPVAVAQVIPPPTIKPASDYVVYERGTTRLVINGTNFREKFIDLAFEPPLERDRDYILSVRSPTMLVLTRMSNSKWRNEPGPLKLRRIDTGGGMIRIDPDYGGVTIAEVQADLDAHGVTVESTPSERFYQSTGQIVVLGEGFSSSNTLRFANGIRGKGVNYTFVQQTPNQLSLRLAANSKWRANPANLPGPMILLAVDAGAGFVPVGPTTAKKGRTVATIFEDPSIERSTSILYRTHSHELWIKGKGFTRGTYNTEVLFEPPLTNGDDVDVLVYNRTHMKVTLRVGKAWASGEATLSITNINTGAGLVSVGNVQVAKVVEDSAAHSSGVSVARSDQVLYQSGALRKIHVSGSGFTTNTHFEFSPPLTENVDYSQSFVSSESILLTLKRRHKWRPEGGALLCMSVDAGKVQKRDTGVSAW